MLIWIVDYCFRFFILDVTLKTLGHYYFASHILLSPCGILLSDGSYLWQFFSALYLLFFWPCHTSLCSMRL